MADYTNPINALTDTDAFVRALAGGFYDKNVPFSLMPPTLPGSLGPVYPGLPDNAFIQAVSQQYRQNQK
jgi:hypothetical protein